MKTAKGSAASKVAMKTITLEEHFVTESFLKATGAYGKEAPPQIAAMRPKLMDLGAGRIAAMDEAGIDLQVMSLASMGIDDLDGPTVTALARDVNDELADAVRAHPDRLAGFALLGMKEPENAAAELERCITQLGFAGVLLDGTCDELFYDDPRFMPVFETAQRLKVPVYLHPSLPPHTVREAYFSGLPDGLGQILSIAGWGWHAETALHTLRLIVAGLFDRLPDLQLIIGHMGEMLPMAMARSSGILSGPAHLRQTVADYFRTNIHLTTSGYFTQPPLKLALEVVGIERMMFSVDYPFSPYTNGRKFLEDAAQTLNAREMEMLAHGNAERLLKL